MVSLPGISSDYLIWQQIIDHIKEVQKPLIFVTSEQKEDWWDKASGQIIGPLYELLKEFYEATGQRFLLYKTDRFLEFANLNSGKKTISAAVEEINYFANQRNSRAIVLDQQEIISESEKAKGLLKVKLIEPAYTFTCTGHFEPHLSTVPNLWTKLIVYPDEMPKYLINSGTGTTFDFHIHLRSSEFGKLLPLGDYTFEYDAFVDPSDSLNN